MRRITNTEEFINKSNEIYHDKFDYSLTTYVKSSEKVKIVCPNHGIFEQTPNKHLKGDGCKLCNKSERLKAKRMKFIADAQAVHGDRYDYSKVDFEASPDGKKVCIICPEHGAFYQTYSGHISLKQNCPTCSALVGGAKRAGVNNVAHRQDVKEKKCATCQERYGTNTWSESDEGRQKLHDIMVSDKTVVKMISTCQERYGADTWSQSDEGREKLREIMNSSEMKTKVVSGYMNTYGVKHYMKTKEGREKARVNISSSERRKKIHESMFEKYGVYSFLESDSFRRVNRERYGTDLYVQSSDYRHRLPEIQKKSWQTKRKNGTYNTSKPEYTMKLLLQDVFGEDDVFCQYNSDRYPFNCDFYIQSLDLFIELNASWTHGGHFFDENNIDDVVKLDKWKCKATEKGSCYYHQAIDVWTNRDLLKLQIAIENDLNYLVFWSNDLTDFRDWLKSQSLL